MNKNIISHVGVAVAAAGAGFGGGWLITKRRARKELDAAVQSVKRAYYAKLEEKPPLAEVAKELKERAEEEIDLKTQVVEAENVALQAGYVPGTNVPEGEFVETIPLTNDEEPTFVREEYVDQAAEAVQKAYEKSHNIFDTEADEAAFHRNPEAPYLISQDSWGEPAFDDFEKIALIYYVDDNTLTTEDDKPIEGIERVVGQKNLTYFGPNSQSGDELILYVRNEQARTDYEILLRKTSYQLYVLTQTPDEE